MKQSVKGFVPLECSGFEDGTLLEIDLDFVVDFNFKFRTGRGESLRALYLTGELAKYR